MDPWEDFSPVRAASRKPDPAQAPDAPGSALRPGLVMPEIDFGAELNEEQRAAVCSEPGPALVLAGAGSGKTRTLTYRVAWLLSQGVAPWSILLLTFTNKAAREMLQRVEDLTGVARSRFQGGTFHHIGQRTLRRHGERIGLARSFSILDQSDAENLLAEAIRGVDAAYLKNKNFPKSRVVAEMISYARNTRGDFGETVKARYPFFDFLLPQFQKFAAAYERLKRERNLCDYDDLLEHWLRLLREHPEVATEQAAKFEHVLVDEYQDTNPLQAEIVDRVGAHHRIMAVGDDAQCIYTWRGADFANIMSFPSRHPGARIFKIETNYRSSPQILEYANGVLNAQPVGSGYFKRLKPVRPRRDPPMVLPLVDGQQQARVIIKRIEALHEEGVPLSHIAVLYRAHFQALDLQLELTRQQVPFTITSGMKFFEQAHIKDLVCQIRFVVNPDDSPAFLRVACLLPRVGEKSAEKLYHAAMAALRQRRQKLAETGRQPRQGDFGLDGAASTPSAASAETSREPGESTDPPEAPPRGSGSSAAEARPETPAPGGPGTFPALLDPSVLAKVPKDAKEDWEALAHTLVDLEGALGSRDPAELVRLAVEGWYGNFLKTAYTNSLQRRDDLDGMISFARQFETIDELLSQVVLMNSETSDRSVEPSSDTIRLTTVHQAKGLEYPVVFVIGLADGMFPLKRAIDEDNLEEERRLFYVAVTRAMDELYLSYPMIGGNRGSGPIKQSPSRFLNEVSRELYEVVRIPASGRW